MILWKNLAFAVIVKLVNVEEYAFRDVSAVFAAWEMGLWNFGKLSRRIL